MPNNDGPVVQLGLRIRAGLRERLKAAADENDNSLNQEVAQRLAASLRDEKLGEVVFRDRATFQLFNMTARVLMALELHRGKVHWTQDPTIVTEALEIVRRVCEIGPALLGDKWDPEAMLRGGAADRAAMILLDAAIRAEQERRTGNAEDAAPPGDEAA